MLPADFLGNPPATASAIDALRRQLPQHVPTDYLELLAATNGGEGFVGNTYVVLFSAEDVIPLNSAYRVNDFAPGLFLFGSNAIGDALAFDCRSDQCGVVIVPFVPLRADIAEPVGKTLTDFLKSQLLDAPAQPPTVNPAAIGKEVHDIKPIAFGGDPNDHANKALVPRAQHAELVVFWNEAYQRLWSSKA